MRVNISNNNVISIDFDTVDQVIDFIKKFNSSNSITNTKINEIKVNPDIWINPTIEPANPYVSENGISYPWVTYDQNLKVTDPIPNTYTVTATNIK